MKSTKTLSHHLQTKSIRATNGTDTRLANFVPKCISHNECHSTEDVLVERWTSARLWYTVHSFLYSCTKLQIQSLSQEVAYGRPQIPRLSYSSPLQITKLNN